MNTFHPGLRTTAAVFRSSQLNTTGVVPVATDTTVAITGLKLPARLRWRKKLTPAATLPGVPPSARFAIITAARAALDVRGSPGSATAPRNLGPSNWRSDVTAPNLAALYP